MLKKFMKFATTLLAVGLVVFSCMGLVAHASAPPAFTSATYNAATGSFVITGTDMVAVAGSSNDILLSKVTITDGVNHSYTLKSKGEITDATTATIVLSAAERTALGAFLDKNGTKALNGGSYQVNMLAGWNGSSSSTDLSGHPLTVSGIAGLTSATYDMATGKLVITGTNIAAVTGTKNDVLPKYITLSDGQTHSYTLTTGGVDIDSATQVTITLNAADQLALQYWVNHNGTMTATDSAYRFTAAYGWNGPQLAQMGTYGITVSNYAPPVVSMNTCSITVGTAITKTSAGLTLSKPGTVYIFPTVTDIEGYKQADFEALVTAGSAIKGVVTSTSSISIATKGNSVPFKMNTASVDFKAVAYDFAGSPSDLTAGTLTINNVPAPAITAAAAPGSVVDSTKVTATAGTGDTLAYKVSSTSIATPKTLEDGSALTAYTSGADITGVSPTNKYLGVYELNSDGKAVKFKQIILAAANIKLPAFKSASVSDKTLTLVTDTLSATPVPSAKSFTVKDNGAADVVTKVEIAEDGESVALTLTKSIASGHTVTVSYTKPTANYLQDAAGNGVPNLAASALTVSISSAAPAISGASIADNTGDADFDGQGIITLPAAGSGDTYVYNIPGGVYSLPALGADVSAWTAVTNGASITFGVNAAAANGKHLLVAEVNGSGHVAKVVDITVSGIADYVPGDAPAITGVSIADNTGDADFDGQGVITLPAAGSGHTYVYKIKSGSETLPKLGDDVSSWTTVADGDSITLGANASEANGKHVFVAEVDGDSLVVKASDITVYGIEDYVSGDAPAIEGASIADKAGETNDGRGVITLPAATGGDTYRCKMPVGEYSLPKLGDDVSSWTPVGNGDVLILGANAAAVNGKHYLVAEVDGDNLVVKVVDITIAGIKDYVAATKGTIYGTVGYPNDQAMADVIGGVDHTFTITDGENTPIVVTISGSITTRGGFQQAIRDAVTDAGQDVYVTSEMTEDGLVQVLISGSTGSSSTISVGGDDAALFFGADPVITPGADAQG